MIRVSIIFAVALTMVSIAALPGCVGGCSNEAKDRVDEAAILIDGSRQLLEDLLDLDGRFNALGTRFANAEDTIVEGKSLVAMALLDVDELESRYSQARHLLLEVTGMSNAGDYAAYAELALQAVEKELEALSANRELLTAVSDMLDVLPLAQSQEQLSYYVAEIERLTNEVSTLLEEGAEAAAEADLFYKEKGL